MEHYYGNKYALKQVFLDEFKKIGVIAPACKKAGISRNTFYRWFKYDEVFVERFFEALDEVYENKKELLRQIPKHKMHAYLRMLVEDEEAEMKGTQKKADGVSIG